MMDIFESTSSYESWMRKQTTVVEPHLKHKHAIMRDDLFVFLKGTFYRWIQLWTEHMPKKLKHAPELLAVGDLHIDSFGTWRDLEGRLVWGIDAFDEAHPLPYTNDLVRLGTSVKLAIDSGLVKIHRKPACNAILDGYLEGLRKNGLPVTRAENEQHLERLGVEEIKPVERFWRKLDHLPVARERTPKTARKALEAMLPDNIKYKIVRRMAGTGSLGQERFVAIGEWKGANIAREAKAMISSACVWLSGNSKTDIYSERILEAADRSHDPFQRVINGWLIRRLSPESNPIEIFDWPKQRDDGVLLTSMGRNSRTCTSAANNECAVSFITSDICRPDGCDRLRKRWPRPSKQIGTNTINASNGRCEINHHCGPLFRSNMSSNRLDSVVKMSDR